MIMTKYLDRFAARRNQRRRPFISEWAPSKDNLRQTPIGQVVEWPSGRPVCRGCGKAAQIELTTETSDRAEYLCYEDLGPFLDLFADPRISEWTIVRLP